MIYLPLAREIDQIVTFFSANQISPFFFIMRYYINGARCWGRYAEMSPRRNNVARREAEGNIVPEGRTSPNRGHHLLYRIYLIQ